MPPGPNVPTQPGQQVPQQQRSGMGPPPNGGGFPPMPNGFHPGPGAPHPFAFMPGYPAPNPGMMPMQNTHQSSVYNPQAAPFTPPSHHGGPPQQPQQPMPPQQGAGPAAPGGMAGRGGPGGPPPAIAWHNAGPPGPVREQQGPPEADHEEKMRQQRQHHQTAIKKLNEEHQQRQAAKDKQIEKLKRDLQAALAGSAGGSAGTGTPPRVRTPRPSDASASGPPSEEGDALEKLRVQLEEERRKHRKELLEARQQRSPPPEQDGAQRKLLAATEKRCKDLEAELRRRPSRPGEDKQLQTDPALELRIEQLEGEARVLRERVAQLEQHGAASGAAARAALLRDHEAHRAEQLLAHQELVTAQRVARDAFHAAATRVVPDPDDGFQTAGPHPRREPQPPPRCYGVARPPPRPKATPSGREPYTILLDLDGTVLHSFFDSPPPRSSDTGDVFSIDLRAGLRLCIEQLVKLKPHIQLGIFTAAAPCYCEGARKLIAELVCGMERDPFDFAIAHDRNDPGAQTRIGDRKDLTLLKRDLDRCLLIDNDHYVVHRQCREQTVITANFDVDPKGRDDTLITVAELVTRLVRSGKPVSQFLSEEARQSEAKQLVYKADLPRGDFYYCVARRCRECHKRETLGSHPLYLNLGAEFFLYCERCWLAQPGNKDKKPTNFKGSRRGGKAPEGLLPLPGWNIDARQTHHADHLRERPGWREEGREAAGPARPPPKPQAKGARGGGGRAAGHGHAQQLQEA
eukprot:TRINITY_DN18243_c0_g1_i1.p1 TRINITY_DN18243_c0_g1~~TRINITY_DN18243_c0_g1_i1.p1  ORF type:complete len:744 (+),score=217.13 TRINITY_DN18243_c0_g1_i1:171-2402(+)